VTDGVAPAGGLFDALRAAIDADEPVVMATVVRADATTVAAGTRVGAKLVLRPGLTPLGTLGDPDLDRVVVRDASGALDLGTTAARHYGPHGEARQEDVTVFVESFAPPPRLVIFGAVDFTAALARVGRVLGYHVTVCDARPVFATRARFPAADEVVVDWPNRYLAKVGASLGPRDAVCVLTHDPKFDVPAVLAALETRVGYLGAMGSRRTHEDRRRRLLEAGADDAELSRRLMSPIGLDIGARTPEETAISICAEIIASRTGRMLPSLRDADGPIHTP
jgi:xanthine dehydrogenase accessory factor